MFQEKKAVVWVFYCGSTEQANVNISIFTTEGSHSKCEISLPLYQSFKYGISSLFGSPAILLRKYRAHLTPICSAGVPSKACKVPLPSYPGSWNSSISLVVCGNSDTLQTVTNQYQTIKLRKDVLYGVPHSLVSTSTHWIEYVSPILKIAIIPCCRCSCRTTDLLDEQSLNLAIYSVGRKPKP